MLWNQQGYIYVDQPFHKKKSLCDYDGIQTQNHLVLKRTLIQLAKLAKGGHFI